MSASNIPTGTPDPGDEQEMKTCPNCDGSGIDKYDRDTCWICEGVKEVTIQEYNDYKSNE